MIPRRSRRCDGERTSAAPGVAPGAIGPSSWPASLSGRSEGSEKDGGISRRERDGVTQTSIIYKWLATVVYRILRGRESKRVNSRILGWVT